MFGLNALPSSLTHFSFPVFCQLCLQSRSRVVSSNQCLSQPLPCHAVRSSFLTHPSISVLRSLPNTATKGILWKHSVINRAWRRTAASQHSEGGGQSQPRIHESISKKKKQKVLGCILPRLRTSRWPKFLFCEGECRLKIGSLLFKWQGKEPLQAETSYGFPEGRDLLGNEPRVLHRLHTFHP